VTVPPIVQYWHEKVLPDDIAEMSATFGARNPELPHLVFDEASADEFIATHLGTAEHDAFRACAVPAMQADYFRYCVVYVLGGVYVDADSRCIASLRPLLEGEGGEIFEGPERGHVHNGFFSFSPRHPFLRLAIDIATVNIQHRISERVWVAAGPWIFMEMVRVWRADTVAGHFEHAMSAAAATNNPSKARYFAALQTAIGGDDRVAAAFRGVRVSPLSKAQSFIVHGGSHLSYKHSESHFPNFPGSIYR
jgi:mannosyltransferase OCH1-like enzyme